MNLYIFITISLFLITIKPVQPQDQPAPKDPSNPAYIQSEGYKFISGYGYYKFHEQQVPWLLAYFTCKWEHPYARLLVINSEDEAKEVVKLRTSGVWAWIGTHDLFQEGRIVTITNQTLDVAGYNTYNGGEPNGGSRENCGVIHRNSKLGNSYCETIFPFYCKINLAK